MPTAGTHITVVEQLVLKYPELKQWLGDPDPKAGDEKMLYAKLGAVGPDLLYMLGDYNSVPVPNTNSQIPIATALQDMLDLLVKVGGTFACFGQLSEQINKEIIIEADKPDRLLGLASSAQQTTNLITGVITDGFLALLVNSGINIWGYFGASARQWGYPPKEWFWADYLHYYHTGEFTRYLLDAAQKRGDQNLIAYSLGYLTHYVTDVVGHPYVNQIVQSPYRLHHQRHHLVENFIDAYVWDRYHIPTEEDPNSLEDSPLDTPTGSLCPEPNPQKKVIPPNDEIGTGSKIITARFNDHITIGRASLGDQIDDVVKSTCQDITNKINNISSWIGSHETIKLDDPQDKSNWCGFMAKTIADYCNSQKTPPSKFVNPEILAHGLDPRPDGYPTEEDVAEAYGILRLVFKLQTEENVKPPVFPDIKSDITQIINDTMQKVANDIGGIPPLPTPNTSGSFSPKDLLKALADIAQWTAEAAEHIAEAVADTVKGIDALEDAVAIETLKVMLWLLNSALYALYRYFRDILVINAYSLPLTDELTSEIGDLNANDLWVSKGDLPNQNVADIYPVAEYYKDMTHKGVDHNDRGFSNDYRPYEIPTVAQPGELEMPAIKYTAPYLSGDRPDAFIEAPIVQDMFIQTSKNDNPDTGAINFGGAIENSHKAITDFMQNRKIDFPNYDMDSDRGYAWLNWQPNDGVWKNLNPDYDDQKHGSSKRPNTVNNPTVI